MKLKNKILPVLVLMLIVVAAKSSLVRATVTDNILGSEVNNIDTDIYDKIILIYYMGYES